MNIGAHQRYFPDLNTDLEAKQINKYPPIDSVTSSVIPTAAAAYYLNRKCQTLRSWACLENGPIRPVRINGRLAWPVGQIISLLNGGKK